MSLKSLKDRQGPGSFKGNTKGVSTGPVDVNFSSASSPGRASFGISYTYVKDKTAVGRNLVSEDCSSSLFFRPALPKKPERKKNKG